VAVVLFSYAQVCNVKTYVRTCMYIYFGTEDGLLLEEINFKILLIKVCFIWKSYGFICKWKSL